MISTQEYINRLNIKSIIVAVQKDSYNQGVIDSSKSVRLTEFASEFLQEGSSDAIDLESILKLIK